MSRHVAAIIVSVLLIFAVIVSVTGLMGKYFGKNAEMITLGLTALVLLVILIMDRNKKE